MSKHRIYLVETKLGTEIIIKTYRLVRARSKYAAERHVSTDQISSRIASQEDLVKHVADGVETADENIISIESRDQEEVAA